MLLLAADVNGSPVIVLPGRVDVGPVPNPLKEQLQGPQVPSFGCQVHRGNSEVIVELIGTGADLEKDLDEVMETFLNCQQEEGLVVFLWDRLVDPVTLWQWVLILGSLWICWLVDDVREHRQILGFEAVQGICLERKREMLNLSPKY